MNVHLIHVGVMDNHGTRALYLSDLSVLKETLKAGYSVSVSTVDVERVKKLDPSVGSVSPSLIDIPYQKADSMAKKFGFNRDCMKYKVSALAVLLWMPAQVIFSILSTVAAKAGLGAPYRFESFNKMKSCDVVICSSGENFKEGASLLPLNLYWILSWWSMLFSRTWEVLIAKSFHKPVIMFPNSIGPFRTRVGRFLSKLSLRNCTSVLIRDPISFEISKSLGPEVRSILTADTALLYQSKQEAPLKVSSNPSVGVSPGIYGSSVSEEEVARYVLAHAKALDKSIEQHGFNVFLMPHFVIGFHHDDMEMSKLIRKEMKNKDQVQIVFTRTVEEFKSLIDRMEMVVSSKMHPAVLATSGYVPTVCIAYDHKQTGFFRRLGMNDCVLNVREVSYESLKAKIDHVWLERGNMKASLRKQIPVLQESVRSTVKMVLSPFLNGKETFRL